MLILVVITICAIGIVIYKSISKQSDFEISFPVGSVLGLTVFTFFLNSTAFLIKGENGIIVAFVSYLLLGALFLTLNASVFSLSEFKKVNKTFLNFYLASIFIWGGFIYWKAKFALIGSDVNLYYAVAHTFTRGNFPPLTPWQPDLPLSYHLGAFELLGALYYFTKLNFEFLHLFLAGFLIFCCIQIIIWLWGRHTRVLSYLWANLIAVICFISFGFIYITWPIFPIQLPQISSINQLVIWVRDLPSVNQAIEVYGAPINLDSFIYFLFHPFGLSIFLSLIVLLINIRRERVFFGWIVIYLSLTALALINESIFVAVFPAVTLGVVLVERASKTLIKNFRVLIMIIILSVLIVCVQGGIITSSVFTSRVDSSALIFPERKDIKDDFIGYHNGQELSKLLPQKKEWLPLQWFHPGIGMYVVVSLIIVLFPRFSFYWSLILKVLLSSALFSLIAYHVIIPKFLIANGNRFLSFSILLFTLAILLAVTFLAKKTKWSLFKKALGIVLFIFIVLPTIFPPLALLSKTRFGENKLQSKILVGSPGVNWMRENVSFNNRVIVLDARAPHPSGQARAMVEAGVFAPVFTGEVRAFTIEASPWYIDIAYYLSPEALKALKASVVLIDPHFYKSLPEIRKEQLIDNKYFTKIFENEINETEWEKIYRVKDQYLIEGGELDGTFKQMENIISKKAKVYIDNEENFMPSFIRRPIIYTLRNRKLYFIPGSGVYLNAEVDIPFTEPDSTLKYNYLVLGKNTDPIKICSCDSKLIWKGLKDEVLIWQVDI